MTKQYGDRRKRCVECGQEFIFSAEEQRWFDTKGYVAPKRCLACRKRRRNNFRKIEKERLGTAFASSNSMYRGEGTKTAIAAEEIKRMFRHTAFSDIAIDAPHTLYIIGNGFDLMHGVSSSYYDFGKTLGKHSNLRFALETYLNVDNLWSDFEEALGHLDIGMMLNKAVLDMWLDDFDAYNPDAKAADFYLAVEAAVTPAEMITDELPKRFRRWVEGLRCVTKERPLQGIMRDAKVLCFNYTEFVEDLYGVSESNVCYIHGCRRKRKGHQKEQLVLGHRPGSNDEEWDYAETRPPRFKN